jgi:hypothetical protein
LEEKLSTGIYLFTGFYLLADPFAQYLFDSVHYPEDMHNRCAHNNRRAQTIDISVHNPGNLHNDCPDLILQQGDLKFRISSAGVRYLNFSMTKNLVQIFNKKSFLEN